MVETSLKVLNQFDRVHAFLDRVPAFAVIDAGSSFDFNERSQSWSLP